MANHKRNEELSKAVQAIRDMTIALLRNQGPEETNESHGVVEFRRNKPFQFFGGCTIMRKKNYGSMRYKKY